LTLDTPPTAFVVVIRTHARQLDGRGEATQREEGGDGYWCGPPDADHTVSWLQRRDPVTRDWAVATGVAAFPTAWDATIAWARHVAGRRRAGRPVDGSAQFLPLVAIPDLGTVPPPSPPARPHGGLPPRRGVPMAALLGQVWA
jgi:hypothetical protein